MNKSMVLIYFMSFLVNIHYSFSQNSALSDVVKERSNVISEAEKNSEELKDLNEEKKVLIDKLVEINKKYDEINKSQTKSNKLTPVNISLTEIKYFLGQKRMGRCKINPGEYAGEYIIQKEKVKIRFSFLPADSVRAPKLNVILGENNDDVFQIEQPGYDPNAKNHKGDSHAILRFKINQDNTPGEFTHAVFMGQRIYDQWFGQSSSLTPTTITCVLGSNL